MAQLHRQLLRVNIILLTMGVENLLYNRLLRNFLRRCGDDWVLHGLYGNGLKRTYRNASLYKDWASLYDYLLDSRTFSILRPLIDGQWKRVLSLGCHLLSSL